MAKRVKMRHFEKNQYLGLEKHSSGKNTGAAPSDHRQIYSSFLATISPQDLTPTVAPIGYPQTLTSNNWVKVIATMHC
jgi:hypothetical protein